MTGRPTLDQLRELYVATFQRLSRSAAVAKAGARLAAPADRLLLRLTGGRLTVLGPTADTIYLTTTGRRSGQPRTVPLLAVRPDGDWVVVGTNFGQPHHPAWSSNLLAEPRATLRYRRTTVPVVARPPTPDERSRAWPLFVDRWPGYADYERRSGREPRMFVLASADIVDEGSTGVTVPPED